MRSGIAAQSDPGNLAALGKRQANLRLKRILCYLAGAQAPRPLSPTTLDPAQPMPAIPGLMPTDTTAPAASDTAASLPVAADKFLGATLIPLSQEDVDSTSPATKGAVYNPT